MYSSILRPAPAQLPLAAVLRQQNYAALVPAVSDGLRIEEYIGSSQTEEI